MPENNMERMIAEVKGEGEHKKLFTDGNRNFFLEESRTGFIDESEAKQILKEAYGYIPGHIFPEEAVKPKNS